MATEKISLTLNESLISEARTLVGRRGLSRYVNEALQHQLQRDRLVGLLNDLERDAGPISSRVMDEVRQAWPSPEDKSHRHNA